MAARDIIQAAAGAAGATEANYIEDCFSCHLYTGTGASQTITNGIDLSTKGGLVWSKSRSAAFQHIIYDTTRGLNKALFTALTNAENTNGSDALTAFNSTGYSIGADANLGHLNTSGYTYASWTFRKQPKFFDIVTYTGNGSANRQITHNLGSVPGMVIVKCTSLAATGGTGGEPAGWSTWHRSISGTGNNLYLNLTNSVTGWGDFSSSGLPFTSSYFLVDGSYTKNTNGSGQTYVAYLFADSNSGGFGPAGTDSVVACGSVADIAGTTVNLGWEPQFILTKTTVRPGYWFIFDNMRGMSYSQHKGLGAQTSGAELSYGADPFDVTSTGFKWNTSNWNDNVAGETMIYLAIRRGPMKTPTDATKVFAPVVRTGTSATSTVSSGFITDLFITAWRSNCYPMFYDRLRGARNYLQSYNTSQEGTYSDSLTGFDTNNGVVLGADAAGSFVNQSPYPYATWNFRRAPGFFDVVCYTGNGTNGATVNHNLGVAPELMIVKSRDGSGNGWMVYAKPLGSTNFLYLHNTDASAAFNVWGNTDPTASVFSLGSQGYQFNGSGYKYVAYLFATCPGVSKVGSYTGTGTTKQIDCGFAAGARFVLIKRTDSTGNWTVWDTARGIVSGNDPYLLLNSTAAEVTNTDYIDPYSAGFEISSTAPAEINASGGTYIYLAIA